MGDGDSKHISHLRRIALPARLHQRDVAQEGGKRSLLVRIQTLEHLLPMRAGLLNVRVEIRRKPGRIARTDDRERRDHAHLERNRAQVLTKRGPKPIPW